MTMYLQCYLDRGLKLGNVLNLKCQVLNGGSSELYRGSASVISSASWCKDGNVRFTKVSLTALPDQV